MASGGPNSPGTVANDATSGTYAWVNPTNTEASDNAYSTTTGLEVFHTTQYLEATNFGFSVPSGATIDGILVEIERKKGVGDPIKDLEVRIIKSDGTWGTTNKADTVNAWPTTDTYKSYGSSSDLWDESWSDTDINDTDFGVVLRAKNTVGIPNGAIVPSVDHIRITVSFTESTGLDNFNPADGVLGLNSI